MALTKMPHWGINDGLQVVAETRHYLSRAEKHLSVKEREIVVMTLAEVVNELKKQWQRNKQ